MWRARSCVELVRILPRRPSIPVLRRLRSRLKYHLGRVLGLDCKVARVIIVHIDGREKSHNVAGIEFPGDELKPCITTIRHRHGILVEIRKLDVECPAFVRRHSRQDKLVTGPSAMRKKRCAQ